MSFGKWNLLNLTKEISSLIGKVKCVKVIRDGSLLIIYNDVTHKEKALNFNKILGETVKEKILDSKRFVSGVISGISPDTLMKLRQICQEGSS